MSTSKETLIQQLNALNDAINEKAGLDGKHTIEDMTSNVEAIATEKPEQTKNVTLDLSNGSQEVTPDSGKVLTSITIQKPNELTAANVRSGVTIAGISGTLEEQKPEQVKSVALNMANGNQVVSPDNGKVLTQVTVEKPNTLIAENIKDGVTIGGVTGILEGAKTEYDVTVDLDFSEGDMYIYPDSDSVFSSIIIEDPENLIPENIAYGVEIAGITGTFEGYVEWESDAVFTTGSSSGEFYGEYLTSGSIYSYDTHRSAGHRFELASTDPVMETDRFYVDGSVSGFGPVPSGIYAISDGWVETHVGQSGFYYADYSNHTLAGVSNRLNYEELYYTVGSSPEGEGALFSVGLSSLQIGDSVSFLPYDSNKVFIVTRASDSISN